MRYINSRFTYLLTYLLTVLQHRLESPSPTGFMSLNLAALLAGELLNTQQSLARCFCADQSNYLSIFVAGIFCRSTACCDVTFWIVTYWLAL